MSTEKQIDAYDFSTLIAKSLEKNATAEKIREAFNAIESVTISKESIDRHAVRENLRACILAKQYMDTDTITIDRTEFSTKIDAANFAYMSLRYQAQELKDFNMLVTAGQALNDSFKKTAAQYKKGAKDEIVAVTRQKRIWFKQMIDLSELEMQHLCGMIPSKVYFQKKQQLERQSV